MNEGICKACRRYVGGTSEKWYCAKDIFESHSYVVPGYVSYTHNKLHPVARLAEKPPDWCEYVVEQVVSVPEDDIQMSNKTPRLVIDQTLMAQEFEMQEKRAEKYKLKRANALRHA